MPAGTEDVAAAVDMNLVMNAKGELIGVNFDRAYHATINDYAWNDNYSRSIAVDIRYVLWVTKYVGQAGFILKEIGVE